MSLAALYECEGRQASSGEERVVNVDDGERDEPAEQLSGAKSRVRPSLGPRAHDLGPDSHQGFRWRARRRGEFVEAKFGAKPSVGHQPMTTKRPDTHDPVRNRARRADAGSMRVSA